MKTVLFACVHNAGRSQMAAALFNVVADPSRARAISAGTNPAAAVHPEVATVLASRGIDLAAVEPRRLTIELASGVDLLVTMGCQENCPAVPGLQRLDWPLTDPKGQPPEVVAGIRDEVERRVALLIEERGWR